MWESSVGFIFQTGFHVLIVWGIMLASLGLGKYKIEY
jgi:hypothetical protein